MIVILNGGFPEIYPLVVNATSLDRAIVEVVTDRTEILTALGLTKSWLDEYGLKDFDTAEHLWTENVLCHEWWACYSEDESDDRIVHALFIDSSRATKRFTGLLFGGCGEYTIFSFNEDSSGDIAGIVYEHMEAGLYDIVYDSAVAFPHHWFVAQNRKLPQARRILPSVQRYDWIGVNPYPEFNVLQLYVIENWW